MISRPVTCFFTAALTAAIVFGPLGPAVYGQTKPDLVPKAEQISPDLLEPAVRQAVANGAAALIARITAEDNASGLAFPPVQGRTVTGFKEVKAKRVTRMETIFEQVEQEVMAEIMQSGKGTGRFGKQKIKVSTGKKIGERERSDLVPDPNGTETMKQEIVSFDTPQWPAYLPGLNGMALYVLAKAGLREHPATVAHAAALAEHTSGEIGLPDLTFDLAWMAAGFAALGPDSPHEKLARRLLSKVIDGQIRESGNLEGLWGPVCVNFTYFGKLMTINQMILHELNQVLPNKLKTASPAEQKKLIAKGKEMKAIEAQVSRGYLDVFRAGMKQGKIQAPYEVKVSGVTIRLPGLPFNVYRWLMSDVESTEAATFAIAVGKKAGLLPKQADRGVTKDKKVLAPLKTDAVLRAAAKRLAAAIDESGGATTLAFPLENKSLAETGYPSAGIFIQGELNNPQLFDVQTACSCVAALDAIESLVAADDALNEQLAEPRQRARDRVKQIAARWCEESADPAADGWKGMYQGMTVSHADLEKSPEPPMLPSSESAVDSLPWGPLGCMYRIVPGFRGLFAGEETKELYKNDLFRQIAYRLVCLQGSNGQWSSPGNRIQSTAVESVHIGRVALQFHKQLTSGDKSKFSQPDPLSYQQMLNGAYEPWMTDAPPYDAALFATLASLVFLVEGIDEPVSLDGIAILPETSAEPDAAGKPDIKRTPVGAAESVDRPNLARTELLSSLAGVRWGEKTPAAAPVSGKPAAAEQQKEEGEQGGLGNLDSLLEPAEKKE